MVLHEDDDHMKVTYQRSSQSGAGLLQPFVWELNPGELKTLRTLFDEEGDRNFNSSRSDASCDYSKSFHFLDSAPSIFLAARHSETESEASSAGRVSAAVPFKWEGEPGISKFPNDLHHVAAVTGSTPCRAPLRLPPSRQTSFGNPPSSFRHSNYRHGKVKKGLLGRFSSAMKLSEYHAGEDSVDSSSEDFEFVSRRGSSIYSLSPARESCARRSSMSSAFMLATCLCNVASIREELTPSNSCHRQEIPVSPPAAMGNTLQKTNNQTSKHNLSSNTPDRKSAASQYTIQYDILSHQTNGDIHKSVMQRTLEAARDEDTLRTQISSNHEQNSDQYSPRQVKGDKYMSDLDSGLITSSYSEGRSTNSSSSGSILSDMPFDRRENSSDCSSNQVMRVQELPKSPCLSCDPPDSSAVSSPADLMSDYETQYYNCSKADQDAASGCGYCEMESGKSYIPGEVGSSPAPDQSPAFQPWQLYSSVDHEQIPVAKRSLLRSVLPTCIPCPPIQRSRLRKGASD